MRKSDIDKANKLSHAQKQLFLIGYNIGALKANCTSVFEALKEADTLLAQFDKGEPFHLDSYEAEDFGI